MPMNTKILKELEQTRAKVAELEKVIAKERSKELAKLPSQFGFSTTAGFLKAVRQASRGVNPTGAARKRRSRSVITDEIRQKVKILATAGKTGAEIAKAVGISMPSVQNVKKALGLTRRHKK